MDKSFEDVQPRETNLNRRELLKVIAASGGGLVAAAFLPAKWLKPVVEAGVLPAHAQGSRTLTLTDIHVELYEQKSNPQGNGQSHFQGTAWYKDLNCRVFKDTTEFFGSTDDGLISDFNVHQTHTEQDCEGNYDFNFNSYCNTVFRTWMTVGGRVSNTMSEDLPPICQK